MKLKLKTLAALIALAASSSAFALEGNVSTAGNSSLIFNAWDADAGVSYTLDTGFNFNDFVTLGSGAFSSNLATDSNWTAFLGAANVNNIVWDVRAWSYPGNPNQAKTTILTTVQTGESFENIIATNGNLSTSVNQIKFAANSNSTIANNPVFTSGSFYSPASNAANGSYAGTYGTDWKGNTGFNTIGTLGDTLNFYSLDNSNVSGKYSGNTPINGVPTPVNTLPATNYVNLGTWKLTTGGALSFTTAAAVTPVPEPSQGALLFAGLAIMGAVARKRLS